VVEWINGLGRAGLYECFDELFLEANINEEEKKNLLALWMVVSTSIKWARREIPIWRKRRSYDSRIRM